MFETDVLENLARSGQLAAQTHRRALTHSLLGKALASTLRADSNVSSNADFQPPVETCLKTRYDRFQPPPCDNCRCQSTNPTSQNQNHDEHHPLNRDNPDKVDHHCWHCQCHCHLQHVEDQDSRQPGPQDSQHHRCMVADDDNQYLKKDSHQSSTTLDDGCQQKSTGRSTSFQHENSPSVTGYMGATASSWHDCLESGQQYIRQENGQRSLLINKLQPTREIDHVTTFNTLKVSGDDNSCSCKNDYVLSLGGQVNQVYSSYSKCQQYRCGHYEQIKQRGLGQTPCGSIQCQESTTNYQKTGCKGELLKQNAYRLQLDRRCEQQSQATSDLKSVRANDAQQHKRVEENEQYRKTDSQEFKKLRDEQQYKKPGEQQYKKPGEQQHKKPNEQQYKKPDEQQQYKKPGEQQHKKPDEQQHKKSDEQQYKKPNGDQKYKKPGEQQYKKPSEQQYKKPGEQQYKKPNDDQKYKKPNGDQQYKKPGEQQHKKPDERQYKKPDEQQYKKPELYKTNIEDQYYKKTPEDLPHKTVNQTRTDSQQYVNRPIVGDILPPAADKFKFQTVQDILQHKTTEGQHEAGSSRFPKYTMRSMDEQNSEAHDDDRTSTHQWFTRTSDVQQPLISNSYQQHMRTSDNQQNIRTNDNHSVRTGDGQKNLRTNGSQQPTRTNVSQKPMGTSNNQQSMTASDSKQPMQTGSSNQQPLRTNDSQQVVRTSAELPHVEMEDVQTYEKVPLGRHHGRSGESLTGSDRRPLMAVGQHCASVRDSQKWAGVCKCLMSPDDCKCGTWQARYLGWSSGQGADQQDKCNFDAAFRKMGEHMQCISLTCQCYYDSCCKENLSWSERRHLRMFHKGILPIKQQPRQMSEVRDQEISTYPSPPCPSFGAVSRAEREKRSQAEGRSQRLGPTPGIDRSQNMMRSLDTEPPCLETELEASPMWEDPEHHGADKPPSATTSQSRSKSQLCVRFSDAESERNLVNTNSPHMKLCESSSQTSQCQPKDLPSSSSSRDEHKPDVSASSRNMWSTQGAGVVLACSTSSFDCSQATDGSLRHQTGHTSKHRSAASAKPDSLSWCRENTTSGTHGPRGVFVEGVSAFPTKTAKSLSRSVRSKVGSVRKSLEQGILITTKPGTYIVRKPTEDSSIHLLHVNPGNYVTLSI